MQMRCGAFESHMVLACRFECASRVSLSSGWFVSCSIWRIASLPTAALPRRTIAGRACRRRARKTETSPFLVALFFKNPERGLQIDWR